MGSLITSVAGSSRYFVGGVIAYSNEVKKKVVGVRAATLRRFGAVSAEVAQEMARGVMNKTGSDVGVAITGIAGPSGGRVWKPVGMVYIAIVIKRRTSVRRFSFKGTRDNIRKAAVRGALVLLRQAVHAFCIEQ